MASEELVPQEATGEGEAVKDKMQLDVVEDTEEAILEFLYSFREEPKKLGDNYADIMRRLRKFGVLTDDELGALYTAMLGDKPDAENASLNVREFFRRIENEKKKRFARTKTIN